MSQTSNRGGRALPRLVVSSTSGTPMRIASMKLLSFAACVLSCAMAYAQPPRVSALEWLSGTWVQASGEEHVTEAWLGPGNGTMVAAYLTVGARGRRSFEFLRIADTE